MAQGLRFFAALADNLIPVPITHVGLLVTPVSGDLTNSSASVGTQMHKDMLKLIKQ